jgi:hypothetical protein
MKRHSSYVLNRLGLDTLRLVLADRIVLGEGPSDEIVFERFYRDVHGERQSRTASTY